MTTFQYSHRRVCQHVPQINRRPCRRFFEHLRQTTYFRNSLLRQVRASSPSLFIIVKNKSNCVLMHPPHTIGIQSASRAVVLSAASVVGDKASASEGSEGGENGEAGAAVSEQAQPVSISNEVMDAIQHATGVHVTKLSAQSKQSIVDLIRQLGISEVDGDVRDDVARVNYDVADTAEGIEGGCIDRTLEDHPIRHGPGTCPGVVACNILEDEAGAPLCGNSPRQWGDYLPTFDVTPARPPVPDTLPFSTAYQRPTIRSYPVSGDFLGTQRPYCQFCMDVINIANALRGRVNSTGQLCKGVPASLKWECEDWAKAFWESSPGLPFALSLAALTLQTQHFRSRLGRTIVRAPWPVIFSLTSIKVRT